MLLVIWSLQWMGSDKCLNAQVLRNDFHTVATSWNERIEENLIKIYLLIYILYRVPVYKISQTWETVWETHLLLSPCENHHRESWEQEQNQPRLLFPPGCTARGFWIYAPTTEEGACSCGHTLWASCLSCSAMVCWQSARDYDRVSLLVKHLDLYQCQSGNKCFRSLSTMPVPENFPSDTASETVNACPWESHCLSITMQCAPALLSRPLIRIVWVPRLLSSRSMTLGCYTAQTLVVMVKGIYRSLWCQTQNCITNQYPKRHFQEKFGF